MHTLQRNIDNGVFAHTSIIFLQKTYFLSIFALLYKIITYSAGITKISHVDSYTTTYLLGLMIEQTTKVYGE